MHELGGIENVEYIVNTIKSSKVRTIVRRKLFQYYIIITLYCTYNVLTVSSLYQQREPKLCPVQSILVNTVSKDEQFPASESL